MLKIQRHVGDFVEAPHVRQCECGHTLSYCPRIDGVHKGRRFTADFYACLRCGAEFFDTNTIQWADKNGKM